MQRVTIVEIFRHIGVDVGILRIGNQTKTQRAAQRRGTHIGQGIELGDIAQQFTLQFSQRMRIRHEKHSLANTSTHKRLNKLTLEDQEQH